MSIRLSSGAVIGGYQIDSLLAEGGMGVVYRARQVELDLPVALKVIRPEWAYDEDFRARFKREARLAASLHHPHVVSPQDFGDHEGQLYVVMPLIPGTDLGVVIEREGPLAPPRAADVIAQVAGALDVAHLSGLVHRDVKPANVLLVRRENREHAYLTDFGVAKAMRSETKITRLGQLPGTPGYVSPEQINGDALDARTDVYSLGCVLCEALTGSVPYPRQTPAAMLIAHMIDAPPRISERVPGAPAGFDDVVHRALAKEPAERFGSAGELAEAAQAAAAVSGAPPRGRRRFTPEPALPKAEAKAQAPVGPEPVASQQAPTAPHARRFAGFGAIVLAAALGALAGAWAEYLIGKGSSFDLYTYGDRGTIFAVSGAIVTGILAIVVGATRRAAPARLVVAAGAGAAIGVVGGFIAASPDGWDSSPRRWLATVWTISGLAAGLGATITSRNPRTIALAALLGALGGGAGALVARGILTTDQVLGEAGFGAFAVAAMIPGSCVGLGLVVALQIAARRHGGTRAGAA